MRVVRAGAKTAVIGPAVGIRRVENADRTAEVNDDWDDLGRQFAPMDGIGGEFVPADVLAYVITKRWHREGAHHFPRPGLERVNGLGRRHPSMVADSRRARARGTSAGLDRGADEGQDEHLHVTEEPP